MAPPNDEIRKRIASTLMSSPCQKISFWFNRVHVDGSGLSFVALALLSKPNGRVGLNVRVLPRPAGVEANYDPSTNTYIVPRANYGQTRGEQMHLVHESVHALCDAYGGVKSTFAVDEEGAAYLAGALYYVYTAPTGTDPFATMKTWNKAHRVAGELAEKVKDRDDTFAISPQEALPLRTAITEDYAFIKRNPKVKFANDGVSL